MQRKKTQGTILNALFFMALLFGMLLVSMTANLFQMQTTGLDEGKEGARRLAEGAAQIMMTRLIKLPNLNAPAPAAAPNSLTVEYQASSFPNGTGQITLDPAKSSALGIPISVNNLVGSNSISPVVGRPGLTVASETANLLAVGRYHNRECKIEVVLHVPKFPYVLGANVPIVAQQGLQVYALDPPGANPFAIINGRQPGHVATNSPDLAGESLKISGSGTEIFGDAQSLGRVLVTAPAKVHGAKLSFSTPVPLPSVGAADWTPPTNASVLPNASAMAAPAQPLRGLFKSNGSLIINGDLLLDNTALYVTGGSLTIHGTVNGRGALIADGDINIDGTGTVTGPGTALLAKGRINLTGQATNRLTFLGMVHSQRGLTCRYANVLGSMVVNNANPAGGGNVDLQDSTLVQNPTVGSVTFITPGGTVTVPPGALQQFDSTTLHSNLGGGSTTYGLNPHPTGYSFHTNFQLNLDTKDYASAPPGYRETHPWSASEPYIQIAIDDAGLAGDDLKLGTVRLYNGDPNNPDADGYGPAGNNNGAGAFPDLASSKSAMESAVDAWAGLGLGSRDQAAIDSWLSAAATDARIRANAFVNQFNLNARAIATYQAQPPTPSPANQIVPAPRVIDTSTFSSLSERIRVLSWRQLD